MHADRAEVPLAAALHILVAVDGLGAYANDDQPFEHPALGDLALTTAERVLGLAPGSLRPRASAPADGPAT